MGHFLTLEEMVEIANEIEMRVHLHPMESFEKTVTEVLSTYGQKDNSKLGMMKA